LPFIWISTGNSDLSVQSINESLDLQQPYQDAAFYILNHTACAACLSENGFMDCHRSCDFLLSDEGKDAITKLHVDGIASYVRESA